LKTVPLISFFMLMVFMRVALYPGFSLAEPGLDLFRRERVEAGAYRKPALSGRPYPVSHIAQALLAMRVGIDRDHDLLPERMLYPSPVQVKPERIGVQLDDHPVRRAGVDHLFVVDGIT